MVTRDKPKRKEEVFVGKANPQMGADAPVDSIC